MSETLNMATAETNAELVFMVFPPEIDDDNH